MNSSLAWFRWFLQRITALILVACLAIHLVLLHFIAPERKFHLVLERIQGNKFWAFFYIAFLLAALFHGLNGTYEILEDYLPNGQAGAAKRKFTGTLKKLTGWFLWILGIACFVYGMMVLWKWTNLK
ncbi:MAG: hypothetical protein AAB019_10750 [Planctomycetota bacterium]